MPVEINVRSIQLLKDPANADAALGLVTIETDLNANLQLLETCRKVGGAWASTIYSAHPVFLRKWKLD